MDVNMKSTVFMSKAVIPGMKAAGQGRIVNMTSVAAHNGGGPGASIYLCQQAAVLSYTKGLAKELASSGVNVNAVSPGFIGQTAFHATFTDDARKQRSRAFRWGGRAPDDVAGSVLFLVSELSSYLTGRRSKLTAACSCDEGLDEGQIEVDILSVERTYSRYPEGRA